MEVGLNTEVSFEKESIIILVIAIVLSGALLMTFKKLIV